MPRIRAARLIHPEHPLHGQAVDIVDRGQGEWTVEAASGAALDAQAGDRDCGQACVFQGWWDLQADFRDPGTERAEGLQQGLQAAATGGFAAVAPVASTSPCRDTPADIQALLHRSAAAVTRALPIAALSEGRKGVQLTEAHALSQAGALGFSDDASIDRPELLRRALEYHTALKAPVFSEAHDPGFQPDGILHEGAVSTRLGLPGLSEEVETVRIRRDLDILRYAGGHLHIPVVTSASGLAAIRAAKEEGLRVTCGTTVHHLCWTDEDLDGFNRDLKLSLPLRSTQDRAALRDAALDGTLDAVVSDHRPRTPEEHDADFMVVAPGIAGIHAVGPALFGALRDHGADEQTALEALGHLLGHGPRQVLGSADVGAAWTFFDPTAALTASPSVAPNTVYTAETQGIQGGIVGVVTPTGSHWNG